MAPIFEASLRLYMEKCANTGLGSSCLGRIIVFEGRPLPDDGIEHLSAGHDLKRGSFRAFERTGRPIKLTGRYIAPFEVSPDLGKIALNDTADVSTHLICRENTGRLQRQGSRA